MKKFIDIDNYEAFAIDFLEGKLHGEVLDAFQRFLADHPDVEEELSQMRVDDLQLYARDISEGIDTSKFKISVSSVGPINESNYEEYFAFGADNALSNEENDQLLQFITENPIVAKGFGLYKRAILRPNVNIVYSEKSSVKKPIPLFEFGTQALVLRIAAAIVLLFGALTLLINVQNQTYTPRSAAGEIVVVEPEIRVDYSVPSETKRAVASNVKASTSADLAKKEYIEAVLPESINPAEIASVPIIEVSQIPVEEIAEEVPLLVSQNPIHSSEMNVLQFIGKRLFHVNPEEAPTTKALFLKSAEHMLASSDRISLKDDSKKNSNSFQIMAGAFEFKKVTYKEN